MNTFPATILDRKPKDLYFLDENTPHAIVKIGYFRQFEKEYISSCTDINLQISLNAILGRNIKQVM
jgi:hypothetical protein